jgi:hypothetical protein
LCNAEGRFFSYAGCVVKLLRQFGVVLLLFASGLRPVMACSNTGVPMSAAERACCRMMYNECERMGMSASSGCCRKAPARAHEYFAETKIAGDHTAPVVALRLTVSDLCAAASVQTGWVEYADDSPPQSPPTSVFILRI